MRFAEPQMLWLLLLIPALAAGAFLTAAFRRRALERFAGGPAHREQFSAEVSPHRRAVRTLLWSLAAAATIVATARPQWGARLEPISRRGVDVVVVLDASRSMAVEDVAPSRLGMARHAASSLMARAAGNRVALVVFAGRATVLCPLTLDHGAARLFLDAVEIDSAPVPGTALADALRVAARAFGQGGGSSPRSRAIVVFTDGEDHEGGMDEALAALREAGVTVHAVGTGSGQGGPIPIRDERGGVAGYKKDRQGRVVTSRLDEALLERIALETGGRYHRATAAEGEIDEIASALAGMDARELGTVLRMRYEERYQIPLGLALVAWLAEAGVGDRRRRRVAGSAKPRQGEGT